MLELGRGKRRCNLCFRTAASITPAISAGDFPAKEAADADIIVMLGALEKVADVEMLFTHLRFCKRDVLVSYHPTNLG